MKTSAKQFRFVIALVAGAALAVPTTASSGAQAAEPGAGETGSPAAASSAFAPTVPNKASPPGAAPEGMVWIPGGEFSMGCQLASEEFCASATRTAVKDTQLIHRVYVNGFWMDATDVTNEKFEKFVKATGYVTIAERTPTKEEFPTAPPENLVAGSVVFTPTPSQVPLDNHYQWWNYVKGANWRHPEGPQSDIKGKGSYPVVHIAYPDAVAFAKWAGNAHRLFTAGRHSGAPLRRQPGAGGGQGTQQTVISNR